MISKGPLSNMDEKEISAADLAKLQQSPYYNNEFELMDFSPEHSMTLPLEPQASYWPFSK